LNIAKELKLDFFHPQGYPITTNYKITNEEKGVDVTV
jgi:hypothetical protein